MLAHCCSDADGASTTVTALGSLLPASSPLLPCVLPSMLDSPDAQHFPGCTARGCSAPLSCPAKTPAHAGHSIIIFIAPTPDAKKENQNCSAPHLCPPLSQALGGVENYESGKQWKASRVVGARVGPGGPELNLAWEDYDHTFNTWEPRANLLDKSLERSYAVDSQVGVDTEQALDEMRELLYGAMAKLRSPEAGMEVAVPTAAFSPVAHALLRRFSRVPSQAGKRPLRIETKQRGGRTKSWVEINGINDVAFVGALHFVRPESAFGALLFKKGRDHARDMYFLGPKFTLE